MDINLIGRSFPAVTMAEKPATQSTDPPAEAQAQTAETEPLVNPMVKVDGETGAAVLSFRSNNDQADFQIPSRTTLEYDRQQRLAEVQPEQKKTTV